MKEAGNWTFDDEIKESFVPRQYKKSSPTKLGTCKFCGGTIIDKGSFYGCSNYQKTGCQFTISKKIKGKPITQKQVKKLLSEGMTDVIDGFKGKDKEFSAKITWLENEKKIHFVFS